MCLETQRLILRPYTGEDFEDLYAILSDEETMRYYPSPFSPEKVKDWIRWNRENYDVFGFGLWAVTLKETGRMIGDCGVTMQKINGSIKPEIGYHIHKDFQGKGYATEAAKKCRDYLFENTPFNRLYSYMNGENIPSFSVAEKNGMQLVETYVNDRGIHLRVYAITRAQWEKVNR